MRRINDGENVQHKGSLKQELAEKRVKGGKHSWRQSDGARCVAALGRTVAAGCSRRWGSQAPWGKQWPGSKPWVGMRCQSPLGPALWPPRCPALGRGLVLGLAKRWGAANTADAVPVTAAEVQPWWVQAGNGREEWDSAGPLPSVVIPILL